LGNGVLTTFPLLAVGVFALGPAGTGALFAARGLGAVIGPLLLRRVLAHRSWLLPGIAMSMATYGVAYSVWPPRPGSGWSCCSSCSPTRAARVLVACCGGVTVRVRVR
jgi:hypothetical protein